jgi:imidazolonepropionase-like amidohydrolase
VKTRALVIAAAALLGIAVPVRGQVPPGDGNLALVNVTLFDGTGGTARPGQTILISGGSIVDVFASGSRDLPAGTAVFDLDGLHVIPGLIDAHAHVGLGRFEEQVARLRFLLEGGITTIRDPSGDARITGYLSRQALIGAIDSPDIFYTALIGGPGFSGYRPVAEVSRGWSPGSAPWAREVHDTTDLSAVMMQARALGVTGVKLYRDLPPHLVRRVADEARSHGLRVWSHTRIRATAADGGSSKPSEVAAAGPDVISHASHFACEVMSCSTGEERSHAVASVDPAHGAIRAILEEMAAKNVVLDPTLVNAAANPEPHWLRFAAGVTALAHRAGVRILAGPDYPETVGQDSFPLLHRELELLVDEAGLTPSEAIIAATATAARVIGEEDTRGTLEVGKRADLVVLRGDPTADIRFTRDIALVIKGGQVVFDAEPDGPSPRGKSKSGREQPPRAPAGSSAGAAPRRSSE